MQKALTAVFVASVSCLFALTASGDDIEQRLKQCMEDVGTQFNILVNQAKDQAKKDVQHFVKELQDRQNREPLPQELFEAVKKKGEESISKSMFFLESINRPKMEPELKALPSTPEGLARCQRILAANKPVSVGFCLTSVYGIMTSVRVGMDLCGDRLEPVSDITYSNLRADLKKYINENAWFPHHRIGADYDEEIGQQMKVRLRTEGHVPFCGETLGHTKRVLLSILQPEQASQIRKRLETPSDPSKGGCL